MASTSAYVCKHVVMRKDCMGQRTGDAATKLSKFTYETESEIKQIAACIRDACVDRDGAHVPYIMDAGCAQLSSLVYATHSAAMHVEDLEAVDVCRIFCGFKSVQRRTRLATFMMGMKAEGYVNSEFVSERFALCQLVAWVFSPAHMSVPAFGVQRRVSDVGAVFTYHSNERTKDALIRRARRKAINVALGSVCSEWFENGVPEHHGPACLRQFSTMHCATYDKLREIMFKYESCADSDSSDYILAMPVLCDDDDDDPKNGHGGRIAVFYNARLLLSVPSVDVFVRSLLTSTGEGKTTESDEFDHERVREHFVLAKRSRVAPDCLKILPDLTDQAASRLRSSLFLGYARAVSLECQTTVCLFQGRHVRCTRLCNVEHARVDIVQMAAMCIASKFGRMLCCCLPERIPLLVDYMCMLQLPTLALEMSVRLAGVCSELQTGIMLAAAICKASTSERSNMRLLAAEECLRDLYGTFLVDMSSAILASSMIVTRAVLGVETFPKVTDICPFAFSMGRSMIPFISCPLVDAALRTHMWNIFASRERDDYIVRLMPFHPDTYDLAYDVWKERARVHELFDPVLARSIVWLTSFSRALRSGTVCIAKDPRYAIEAASYTSDAEDVVNWLVGYDPRIYDDSLMDCTAAEVDAYASKLGRTDRVQRIVDTYEEVLVNLCKICGSVVEKIIKVVGKCNVHLNTNFVVYGKAVGFACASVSDRAVDCLQLLVAGSNEECKRDIECLLCELACEFYPLPIAVGLDGQRLNQLLVMLPDGNLHLSIVMALPVYSTYGDPTCYEDYSGAQVRSEFEGIELDRKKGSGNARSSIRCALLFTALPHEKIVLVPQESMTTIHTTCRWMHASAYGVDVFHKRFDDVCVACMCTREGYSAKFSQTDASVPCTCTSDATETRCGNRDMARVVGEIIRSDKYTKRMKSEICAMLKVSTCVSGPESIEASARHSSVNEIREIISYLTGVSTLVLSSSRDDETVFKHFPWKEMSRRIGMMHAVTVEEKIHDSVLQSTLWECVGTRCSAQLITDMLKKSTTCVEAVYDNEQGSISRQGQLVISESHFEIVEDCGRTEWLKERQAQLLQSIRFDIFTPRHSSADTFIAQFDKPFGMVMSCVVTKAVRHSVLAGGVPALIVPDLQVIGYLGASGHLTNVLHKTSDRVGQIVDTVSNMCLSVQSLISKYSDEAMCSMPVNLCIAHNMPFDATKSFSVKAAVEVVSKLSGGSLGEVRTPVGEIRAYLSSVEPSSCGVRSILPCVQDETGKVFVTAKSIRAMQIMRGKNWLRALCAGDIVQIMFMYFGAVIHLERRPCGAIKNIVVDHIWEPAGLFRFASDV